MGVEWLEGSQTFRLQFSHEKPRSRQRHWRLEGRRQHQSKRPVVGRHNHVGGQLRPKRCPRQRQDLCLQDERQKPGCGQGFHFERRKYSSFGPMVGWHDHVGGRHGGQDLRLQDERQKPGHCQRDRHQQPHWESLHSRHLGGWGDDVGGGLHGAGQ